MRHRPNNKCSFRCFDRLRRSGSIVIVVMAAMHPFFAKFSQTARKKTEGDLLSREKPTGDSGAERILEPDEDSNGYGTITKRSL